jgi:ElaB/YqjD/DUF883 family membrane-anchored ribosome-binding protein
MADPLRKLPSEEEETIELEIIPGAERPGTPPDFIEVHATRIERETHPFAVRTAENLGAAVGGAVGNVSRSVRTGLDAATTGSKQAGDKLAELADQARVRAQDLSLEAGRLAQDMREAAIYRSQRLRREAREFMHQKPLEAILAIAGAAFVFGFALRIWRSNRG